MSKTRDFFDLNHAGRYLANSVIRYNRMPIKVIGCAPSGKAHVYKLVYEELLEAPRNAEWGDDGRKSCLHNSDKIDMTPVPLGFLSTKNADEGDSLFLARTPARVWHVGLHRDNTAIYHPCFNYPVWARGGDVVHAPSFFRMIMNKYLEPEEALLLSQKHDKTRAFSRRFAIFDDKLMYKTRGHPVGEIKNKKPELYNEFGFLKEALAEDWKR